MGVSDLDLNGNSEKQFGFESSLEDADFNWDTNKLEENGSVKLKQREFVKRMRSDFNFCDSKSPNK